MPLVERSSERGNGLPADHAVDLGKFLTHPIIVFQLVEQIEQWLDSRDGPELPEGAQGVNRRPRPRGSPSRPS